MRTISIASLITLAAAAAGALACAPAALAQSPPAAWPQRAVKIITPLPPGTGVDFTARLYADRLAKRWGQPVTVENRVGADGIAATSSFVAGRDDHTLLLSIGAPFTSAPLTNDRLPYDPVADVTPIGLASEQYLAMAIHAGLPVKSVKELEAAVRAQPGKLNWAATTGLPFQSFLNFVNTAGLSMANVTYRDATSALNDLGEGRIHVYLTGLLTVMPAVQGGKARVIAMLGNERNPLVPEVPTVKEAGYPQMTVDGFTAMFGWKGMPDQVRDRIAADMAAVAADTEAQKKFTTVGLLLRFQPAAVLSKALVEQRAWIGEVLRREQERVKAKAAK